MLAEVVRPLIMKIEREGGGCPYVLHALVVRLGKGGGRGVKERKMFQGHKGLLSPGVSGSLFSLFSPADTLYPGLSVDKDAGR